jgi:hypothetical protein
MMKLDIKRAFWLLILGSLVVIAGSIGAIRAVYADDFWSQQGWILLMALGFILVVWGFRRGSKSN